MRAAFIHAAFDVRIGELDEPVASKGEVLVDVEAVGICGSDLHYYKEGSIGAAQTILDPFVPGHEFSGRVRSALPEQGIEAGDLVIIDPCQPCWRCEWCGSGEHNLCPNVKMLGAPPFSGAMTETISVLQSQIFAAPKTFSAGDAAMAEPLGIGIHAMDLARLKWSESLVILGAGPIGLILLQLARLQGVQRIMVVEPVEYRRKSAELQGASAVSASFEDVSKWTGGRGADVVIEATNSPDGLQHAVHAARIGGRCLLVGIPDGNSYALEASSARRKQLSLTFSRRMGDVLPRAIELIADERVDFDAIISHRIGLDDIPQAFDWLVRYVHSAQKILILGSGSNSGCIRRQAADDAILM